VEGLVARIGAEFGQKLKVVATGGLAPLFAEGTEVLAHIEPELTLDGLRMLAKRNPVPTLAPGRMRPFESD
jgi:type III pantothenate kinase